MIQYVIAITTHYAGNHKETKYSKAYNSVAELFAAPKAAEYVQKSLNNKFVTVSVRKIDVDDSAF